MNKNLQITFVSETPLIFELKCKREDQDWSVKLYNDLGFGAVCRGPDFVTFRQKTFFEKYILRV